MHTFMFAELGTRNCVIWSLYHIINNPLMVYVQIIASVDLLECPWDWELQPARLISRCSGLMYTLDCPIIIMYAKVNGVWSLTGGWITSGHFEPAAQRQSWYPPHSCKAGNVANILWSPSEVELKGISTFSPIPDASSTVSLMLEHFWLDTLIIEFLRPFLFNILLRITMARMHTVQVYPSSKKLTVLKIWTCEQWWSDSNILLHSSDHKWLSRSNWG